MWPENNQNEMKKLLFLISIPVLVAVAALAIFVLPGRLSESDYVNFKPSDIQKEKLTNFVLQDKKILSEHPEYQQDIVASKPVAGQNSVALTFKNPQAASTFVQNVTQKFGSQVIEKDVVVKAAATLNDPYYPSQTNLSQMEMSTGWDYLSDSSGAKIALVD